jgi:hypothetical protein
MKKAKEVVVKSKKAPKTVAKAMKPGVAGTPCPKCKKPLPKSGMCNVCKSMDTPMGIVGNNSGG